MKYGIYNSYWEKEWGGDPLYYIPKVKKLGFDILEVAVADFPQKSTEYLKEIKKVAEAEGIIVTGGYGPAPEHNLSSADPAIIENAFAFWKDVLARMELAGIGMIGGALYSYWPVDYTKPFDKKADTERSIENMKKLAVIAADHGVTLGMEALNRFEGYMINESYECIDYVNAVGKPNVKVMLDTFHMNIEEDSFEEAIIKAGDKLGHLHVGEGNRRPPHAGSRFNWESIGKALKQINYDGYVVMEPFVRDGGKIGRDIYIWRDLSNGASDEQLDADAAESVAYLRGLWG